MSKRTVSPALQKLLKIDAYFTELLCKGCERFASLRSLRIHYKVLEVSGNGIVWIAGWLALIWILWSADLCEMQVNFLNGLFLDVLAVSILKAIVRRRRPPGNKNDDVFGTYSVDKYSFPSGHVSRACFIACFFYYLYPVSIIFYPPLLAWVISLALSRILLRRHYIIDVLAGALLGIIECSLISLIWLNKDIAAWLINWVSDEKLEGGEYHV